MALVSASALAYEVLLMRLFSIIQWHHFAYMIISLALLGYGVSGTVLALSRRWWRHRVGQAFVGGCILFGGTSVVCFLLAQRLPFNALELLWDPLQPAWLLLVYLYLLVPFMAAASCICLAFMSFPGCINRVYAADLLGAGLGGLVAIGLLFATTPERALAVLGGLGLLAAAWAGRHFGFSTRSVAGLLLAAVLASSVPVELRLSQFKELSVALDVMGAQAVDRRTGPLGWLTTVASPEIPFRHAPGLSLNAPGPPPEQLAVFTDGDAPTMITRWQAGAENLRFLDYVSSALPYHLLDHPSVLVLGSGGGSEVLQALSLGAARVDAVELNPQLIELVDETFASFSGGVYSDARVHVHPREARGFVAASTRRYDLIQVSLLDSFSASAAGLHALSENYLYTVEAFGGSTWTTCGPGGCWRSPGG